MRKTINKQMLLGEVDISTIEFDLRSRDEIPKLLMGLQAIYCTAELKEKVFLILEETIPKSISKTNGRPGMLLWKILVLGTLRLNCNWNYDKVKEMADNHLTLREMLGHTRWLDRTPYKLQTIKDNISLLTVEVLEKINKIVVCHGHNLIKKKSEELNCRCDSFVVESNTHYPTDMNLLYDAVRKSVEIISAISNKLNLTTWRQKRYQLQKLKRTHRKLQKMRHSNSKDELKKEKRELSIKNATRDYVELAGLLLKRISIDIDTVKNNELYTTALKLELVELNNYLTFSIKFIDQIKRRVINDETIPHCEKIFSIFEEYTEWISKGKAGVRQELGLNLCVMQDQFGFTLNYRIMHSEVDKTIAVPFLSETKKLYPNIKSCSFDKGFWSPDNKVKLEEIIDDVILPKKGRLSIIDKKREYSDNFRKRKNQHSAVESDINALENHGLDMCPDHGLKSFEKYIALAVVARNFQILGNLIQKKELARKQRSTKMKQIKRKLAA